MIKEGFGGVLPSMLQYHDTMLVTNHSTVVLVFYLPFHFCNWFAFQRNVSISLFAKRHVFLLKMFHFTFPVAMKDFAIEVSKPRKIYCPTNIPRAAILRTFKIIESLLYDRLHYNKIIDCRLLWGLLAK